MNVLEAFVHDPLVEWESEYNKKVSAQWQDKVSD